MYYITIGSIQCGWIVISCQVDWCEARPSWRIAWTNYHLRWRHKCCYNSPTFKQMWLDRRIPLWIGKMLSRKVKGVAISRSGIESWEFTKMQLEKWHTSLAHLAHPQYELTPCSSVKSPNSLGANLTSLTSQLPSSSSSIRSWGHQNWSVLIHALKHASNQSRELLAWTWVPWSTM